MAQDMAPMPSCCKINSGIVHPFCYGICYSIFSQWVIGSLK